MKYIDLAEFRDEGYLQEVNRGFFHPHGLALEISRNEDGLMFARVRDHREDLEGVVFDELDDRSAAAKAANVAREMEARKPIREAALGYWQQPIQ